jgi:hypothetical protein
VTDKVEEYKTHISLNLSQQRPIVLGKKSFPILNNRSGDEMSRK